MRFGLGLGLLLSLFPISGSALDLAGAALEDTARARLLGLTRTAASYNCADVSCKRLSSCEEACFKLIQCGQRKRDGDHDGIPCESLCSRPCPR